MKLLVMTLLTFLPSSLFATGNEAGGRWVVNKFKAEAFDVMSAFCRVDWTNTGLDMEATTITRIEADIASLEIVQKEELAEPMIIDKKARKIFLKESLWKFIFDHSIDARREIFAAYLSLHRSEPLTFILAAERVREQLHPVKPQYVSYQRDGRIVLKLLSRFIGANEMDSACDFEPREAFKDRSWEIADVNYLANHRQLILDWLAKEKKALGNFLIWHRGGELFDLFTGADWTANQLADVYAPFGNVFSSKQGSILCLRR